MASLSEEDKKLLESSSNFYEIQLTNIGGLVSPIILEFEFVDGTKEKEYIPAEIWKMTREGGENQSVTKVFMKNKEVKSITLDPNLETADTDVSNNNWPQKATPSKFEMFRNARMKGDSKNKMQKSKL